MKQVLHLVLLWGVTTTSLLHARDEQWLQYHTSVQADRIVGIFSPKTLKLAEVKPQGVDLPEFNCDRSLFAYWPTPMVQAGGLWIALDRSQANGVYDRLIVDSNGNMNLTDDDRITASKIEGLYASWGPVKVTFEGDDGPIAYHLNVDLLAGQKPVLYVRSGGWYEGTVAVGQDSRYCVLIDNSVNGTFDDRSIDPQQRDWIRIGARGRVKTSYVGNYIELESRLYRLEVARDGAYIKLFQATDLKFGTVRLPQSVVAFSAAGQNGLIPVKLENSMGRLPVGKYRVERWTMQRTDEAGARWKIEGGVASAEKGLFEVTEGRETVIATGDPIVACLQVQTTERTHSFRHSLKGPFDERILLTRDGKQPPAPRLRIRSEDGTYVQTYSFEYG